MRKPFRFKQFEIYHDQCAMKVGTDGVLLGAWATVKEASKVLDIGTGTGMIAIMLAQRCQTATQIHGVELNQEAYQQALENQDNCPWKERVEIFHQKIQDFQSQEKYDVIVSNPPFFLAGTKSHNHQRNQARHTNELPFDDLLKSVDRLLSQKGKFSVILPYQEGKLFEEKALEYKLYCVRKTAVRSKKEKPLERFLLEFERENKAVQEDELIIQYEQRNHYTEDYIALTKDFYLNM